MTGDQVSSFSQKLSETVQESQFLANALLRILSFFFFIFADTTNPYFCLLLILIIIATTDMPEF